MRMRSEDAVQSNKYLEGGIWKVLESGAKVYMPNARQGAAAPELTTSVVWRCARLNDALKPTGEETELVMNIGSADKFRPSTDNKKPVGKEDGAEGNFVVICDPAVNGPSARSGYMKMRRALEGEALPATLAEEDLTEYVGLVAQFSVTKTAEGFPEQHVDKIISLPGEETAKAGKGKGGTKAKAAKADEDDDAVDEKPKGKGKAKADAVEDEDDADGDDDAGLSAAGKKALAKLVTQQIGKLRAKGTETVKLAALTTTLVARSAAITPAKVAEEVAEALEGDGGEGLVKGALAEVDGVTVKGTTVNVGSDE